MHNHSTNVREWGGQLWIFLSDRPYRKVNLAEASDYRLAVEMLGEDKVEEFLRYLAIRRQEKQ